MADYRNAVEVKQHYLQTMGPDLGAVFHAVTQELTWVHWRWKQYRILFGERPARLDLLNKSASHFFYIVQKVLFEATVLSIATLLPGPRSVGNDNLTMFRFPPLISDLPLRAEVETLLDSAKQAAAFARDWRNRHIAHRDLRLALGRGAQPLSPASRTSVEDALLSLRRVVNRIELAYCDATSVYDEIAGAHDAEALLYVLNDGLLSDQERRARIQSGKFTDADLKPFDL